MMAIPNGHRRAADSFAVRCHVHEPDDMRCEALMAQAAHTWTAAISASLCLHPRLIFVMRARRASAVARIVCGFAFALSLLQKEGTSKKASKEACIKHGWAFYNEQ